MKTLMARHSKKMYSICTGLAGSKGIQMQLGISQEGQEWPGQLENCFPTHRGRLLMKVLRVLSRTLS
jgi:hypothetical protein